MGQAPTSSPEIIVYSKVISKSITYLEDKLSSNYEWVNLVPWSDRLYLIILSRFSTH